MRRSSFLVLILISILLIKNTTNLIIGKIDYGQVTYDILHYPLFMYNFRLNIIISNLVLLLFIALLFYLFIKYKKPDSSIFKIAITIFFSIIYLYFFRVFNFHKFEITKQLFYIIKFLFPILVVVLTLVINQFINMRKVVKYSIFIISFIVFLLSLFSYRIYYNNFKIENELNNGNYFSSEILKIESGFYNIEFDRILEIALEYESFPSRRLSKIEKEEIEAILRIDYKFDILKITERLPIIKIKTSDEFSKISHIYTFYGEYMFREYNNEIFIYNIYEKNNSDLEKLKINIINILDESLSYEVIK